MRRRLPFLALGAAVVGVVVAVVLAVGPPGGEGGEPEREVRRIVLFASPAERLMRKREGELRFVAGPVSGLAARARRGPFELRTPVARRDGVVLRDVVVRAERDGRIVVAATVADDEVSRAAPGGVQLRYDPDSAGDALRFTARVSVLGFARDVDVPVEPRDGTLVALAPEPVGEQVLLDDPSLRVDRVRSAPRPERFRVAVEGALR